MVAAKTQPHGFTLVELLSVFCILSLLLCLALPAISSGREAARKTQCLNNLHEFGITIANGLTLSPKIPIVKVNPPRCPTIEGLGISNQIPDAYEQQISGVTMPQAVYDYDPLPSSDIVVISEMQDVHIDGHYQSLYLGGNAR